MKKNLVAIVGKPNVGKSTLFNKISAKKIAIVDDFPGVTRDRIYNQVSWNGKNFSLIDTGGIELANASMQEKIRYQAKIAIAEANLILFLVDGRNEITSDDLFVLKILRQSSKKILLVANKIDGTGLFDSSIYSLGFDKIFSISAIHGQGIGDLLDEILENLDGEVKPKTSITRLSIIGKPNVGKSSLLNILTNSQRSIVSEIPGTTRDSVSEIVQIYEQKFEIIDTAGILKKSKLLLAVEHYALIRALNSLENCDISLLILDASETFSHFHARIAGYIFHYKKPVIIVVNKWDLILKDANTINFFKKKILQNFKFIDWAPIIFVSTLKNQRIEKLKQKIIQVQKNVSLEINPRDLNSFITEIQIIQPAPSLKSKKLVISFCKQVPGKIPTFLLFVNNKNYCHFSYLRHLENKFREYFNLEGAPINLILKNKS